MLNNNFSYTQHAFAFFPQKDPYCIHNDTDPFFLFFFFFKKILISILRHFIWAFSFSSSERFWYLSGASFWSFSCVFDNSYLSFLSKNISISILYEYFMNCFEQRLGSCFFIHILYLIFFIKIFFTRIFILDFSHQNLLHQNQKKFLYHQ